MSAEFLNPPSLCPTFGWTHVVAASGGKTVYVSGQVGINEKGEVVGKGDLKRQTEQAFENIRLALEATGATFKDVVKTSLYVVGLRPEHVSLIREVRARYVWAENPPSSTLVGVSALVGPDWLIEIEAVAVVHVPQVRVEWRGAWYAAEILKQEGNVRYIKYVGFGDEWNEWVGPERMRME